MLALYEAAESSHREHVAGIAVGPCVALKLARGVAVAEHDSEQISFMQRAAATSDKLQPAVLPDFLEPSQDDVTRLHRIWERQKTREVRQRHATERVGYSH